MKTHPLAGHLAPKSQLCDIPKLLSDYYFITPDPTNPNQKVAFGTSGHRGSSTAASFNENHILAITQAICQYRQEHSINGPLFLGIDTHALSVPAMKSALEVLAANGVNVMLPHDDGFTPTPVISHAILIHNKSRKDKLADGIVITPSHNPPNEGGFKYNPPTGGPADTTTTSWIQNKANELLTSGMQGVKRVSYEKALASPTTHRYNYLDTYIDDLPNVVDIALIRHSQIKIGVDPLGGAGLSYWNRIADKYQLNMTVVNQSIDPQFPFMSLDWDGQIRMDPSSPFVMNHLISLKNDYDVAFACDTDHDRHGIVAKSVGLLSANNYLSTAAYYLFTQRSNWKKNLGIGKTVVTTMLLDRIAKNLDRPLYEYPAGFKWFVQGLNNGTIGFSCEESAGATFNRFDGTVWTTDKDAIIASLLAAEMTARLGKDPGQLYQDLTAKLGNVYYDRIDRPATTQEKILLKAATAKNITTSTLAGDPILTIQTHAPSNEESIGGVKVITKNGWFAARPSGTENIYKIYCESGISQEHLKKIIDDAQAIVDHIMSLS